MTTEQLTADAAPQAPEFIELEASADGKRNTHSFFCRVVEQTMNYAACLWRQAVLDNAKVQPVKTPADWNCCKTPSCTAASMRAQEIEAGRALFFAPRATQGAPLPASRRWGEPRSTPARPTAPARPRATDALDAIGSVGTYADALNQITEAEKTTPAPDLAPAATPAPVRSIQALPGETPLQTARRLAAERVSQSAQP